MDGEPVWPAPRTYALRSGRITPSQSRARAELFSRFGLELPGAASRGGAGPGPFSGPGDAAAAEDGSAGSLDFEKIFGNGNPVIAEIGFGMGRATVEIAASNPRKNYLGIEVHRAGVGRLLRETGERGLSNLRVAEHDAVDLFRRLVADASLAGIHLFFPDPWPKKRHRKRRLVTRPFTDLLARKLRFPEPGGDAAAERPYLYMATDWEDYALHALAELSATPGLRNPYPGFAPRQAWRPVTEFERKGLAQKRGIREIFFEKAPFPGTAGPGGKGGDGN